MREQGYWVRGEQEREREREWISSRASSKLISGGGAPLLLPPLSSCRHSSNNPSSVWILELFEGFGKKRTYGLREERDEINWCTGFWMLAETSTREDDAVGTSDVTVRSLRAVLKLMLRYDLGEGVEEGEPDSDASIAQRSRLRHVIPAAMAVLDIIAIDILPAIYIHSVNYNHEKGKINFKSRISDLVFLWAWNRVAIAQEARNRVCKVYMSHLVLLKLLRVDRSAYTVIITDTKEVTARNER